jgi:phosphoribosylanthranilate isomerase
MKDQSNVANIVSNIEGIDWMGFIFYDQSKRFLATKLETLPGKVERVGVFVNEELDTVLAKIILHDLNIVQLHGEEPPIYCKKVRSQGLKVMKAFAIGKSFNFDFLTEFEESVDFFLFDTKGETVGGTGKKFDWDILNKYEGNIPFLLAGGIGLEDIERIKNIRFEKCIGIDINSRFENAPGIKSLRKLKSFIDELRS